MNRNTIAWLFAVFSALVFFGIAFSALDGLVKGVLMLIVLGASGMAIKQLTNLEGYYGLLVVRGDAGLGLMKSIARDHPKLCTGVVDIALAICFGVPYSFHAFGLRDKRAWLGALANLLFFSFFFIAQVGNGSLLFLCLGLVFGLVGLGIGFIAQHAWSVLTIPNTPPGVTLLVPGVTVPWEAIFSIIIIAIVHELAHGVLANIEKVKIKASGALLFGFLPVGAFVEPDEAALARKPLHTKRRVLAAGSISNIVFFFVFLVLTIAAGFAFNATVDRVVVSSSNSSLAVGAALTSFASAGEAEAFFMQSAASGNAASLIEVNGVVESVRFSELKVMGVRSDYPSSHLFEEGNLILSVDGERVNGLSGLKDALANKQEGDEVLVGTAEGADLIVLGPNAQMGVTLSPVMLFKLEDEPNNALAYAIASFVLVVFSFAYVLNFILATVNLLPLFITDGHRIIYEELKEAFGQRKAERVSLALGILALLLLALNAAPWLWA